MIQFYLVTTVDLSHETVVVFLRAPSAFLKLFCVPPDIIFFLSQFQNPEEKKLNKKKTVIHKSKMVYLNRTI
jgi:hypothetical protein